LLVTLVVAGKLTHLPPCRRWTCTTEFAAMPVVLPENDTLAQAFAVVLSDLIEIDGFAATSVLVLVIRVVSGVALACRAPATPIPAAARAIPATTANGRRTA
jgi:hypothetical protein